MSPITAAKGLNLLVEQGVLYKKRGVGMFVAVGAKSRLQSQRRAEFSESHVAPLVREVRLLHIHKDELAEMIDKGCLYRFRQAAKRWSVPPRALSGSW